MSRKYLYCDFKEFFQTKNDFVKFGVKKIVDGIRTRVVMGVKLKEAN